MMGTEITPEQMEIYKRTARLRHEREQAALAARREAALAVAREAARVLKEQHGVRRVILFGSLAHGAWFHSDSDIDLAVEGVRPGEFFSTWAALDRVSPDFEINLVAVESAPAGLRESIEREGIVL